MTQWIFYFGEKGKEDKKLLGGKGANLSEMTKLGLPIPSGFTLSTECCMKYVSMKGKWPAGLAAELQRNVKRLEKNTGKKFGDSNNPLLVSVRSGAAISMPGMMDTVLNLGLNDTIIKGFAKNKGPRFAFDSYRRFITMFSDVVMGIERLKFERLLDKIKEKNNYSQDTDLTTKDLQGLVENYKILYQRETGHPFPTDPQKQLRLAIDAVFDSWDNPRAIKYRQLKRIPDDIGTAVNVQEMVFGNMGNDCATGVAFTRNPSTGENKRYGEYLTNAQGEDVVAGIRTPQTIEEMKVDFPEQARQLYALFEQLESHYHNMQDIEFTIENKKLYILQTRNGKRTATAAVKMAVDMVHEGLIDKKTAVMRVDAEKLETLLHPQLDPVALKNAKVIATGLPASPGGVFGQVVFTADQAVKWKSDGKQVILVRLETSPEDIAGMVAAVGVLTARGGMTSHAAVVARGMGICCIAGCSSIVVNEKLKTFTAGGETFKEGDVVSLNGTSGNFYRGKMPVVKPILKGEFGEFMSYCKKFSELDVLTNADNPADAKIALDFGAQGIGLCRTEHMFFDEQRIFAVRQMILAETLEKREKALAKLLPHQRSDFKGIMEVMSGKPVIIRLLDPPLHEFLPHEEREQMHLANEIANGDVQKIKAKVESLSEVNPMLGFRGCRLGVVYPEISTMQIRAIFLAALDLKKEGKDPRPYIEVPLAGNVKEFLPIKNIVIKIAKETGAEGRIPYRVGTMIEVPRAALRANEFAAEADFMSFGTNDLTQMTCGFSRDDSATFLKHYVNKKIYSRDPFQAIDQEGVGRLMRICISLARCVKPNIDFGICGEHAGEASSVEFCHRIGLDNVSCSPYRVPVAILASAQAHITHGDPKRMRPDQILLTSKI